ncbi:MAG TPA: hypothetical protein VK453_11365 [Micromonosporaceae bacterium]|nr:hypothetical protein [Micromonosporaceae bacterium]
MANTPRLRRSAIVALTLGFGVLGGAAAGIAEASSGDHRDPRPGPSGTFVRPSNGPGGPGGVPTARPDRPRPSGSQARPTSEPTRVRPSRSFDRDGDGGGRGR